MPKRSVIYFLCFVNCVLSQGTGSGTDGNLRLCVVEGRGTYKRATRYCPILDREKSGIECVLGTDRLDCLRRISKGSVDFGVFSPEDLIAAQWAQVDVLVTNEIRSKTRPYARTIVAVANRRILEDGPTSLSSVLRNSSLCHPGVGIDDIRPLSDTLSGYLESLVLARSCDPALSLTENRIRAMSQFFGKTCKAGPWVPDKARDAELKRLYPSLCAGCSGRCDVNDPYWGDSGALACLVSRGDVTWGELDDVRAYFGLTSREGHASADRIAYLCLDGSYKDLDDPEPCVWLSRPWPVIVSKRKAAEAVAALASNLTDGGVLVDQHWRGALAALLELHLGLPQPLAPAVVPLDYLARAQGLREAYSQTGCQPSRHITLCTKSVIESNKCNWLAEAGAVYGIVPPLQCTQRSDVEDCLKAVKTGTDDVVLAGSDWLVRARRDYSVDPVLHEATPIVDQTSTVAAIVLKSSAITDTSYLKGKRASFPSYDGLAWHSVFKYINEKEKLSCQLKKYFSDVCAPGIEKRNLTEDVKTAFTKICYKEGDNIVGGEEQALKAVVAGKADVAFVSLATFNLYKAQEPQVYNQLVPVCPKENPKYCFLSWANIGHVLAANTTTAMRKQEIINVFTKLDQLFGKHYPFHNAMFSMYGPFNHQLDVLFHNNTKILATDNMLNNHPYDKIPLNFERQLSNDSLCYDLNFSPKLIVPTITLISLSLVAFIL
ncbi:transferrin-like [Plodia interpunctella]|uniref:transferrin-like n=1 Tax=Plodia interpunctella TaxID=58824 RepID=UPI0023689AFA|nr:transferrin-like [Plodia interpunctella]